MAMARSPNFKTPDCRVSFAHTLFKPRKQGMGANAKEKYGATLIFPKAALTAKECKLETGEAVSLQDIVAGLIVEEWGEKGLERAKKGLIKSPFLSGDGKEARNKETGELHAGMGEDVFFIRVQANLDRPPKISSSPSAFIPATQEEVYSGCYGYAVLNAFAWNNPENGDGVSFGINVFFKRRDGEVLGGSGSSDPEKWVEQIDDQGEAPAATKGGAGAAGLFG